MKCTEASIRGGGGGGAVTPNENIGGGGYFFGIFLTFAPPPPPPHPKMDRRRWKYIGSKYVDSIGKGRIIYRLTNIYNLTFSINNFQNCELISIYT